MRILVVEDNKDNAETLAEWLRMAGHTVWVYGDAPGIFRHLTDGPRADVAVIDLKLPGSDGTTVARAMRVLAPWRYVPVVLTSSAVDELPGDSPFGGPTVSLRKPFTVEELLSKIERASQMQVR
jgi:CheY-like chemotaxis protein